MSKCHVLLRERDGGDAQVHAVYESRADLDARVESIGRRNPQYPMRQLSPDMWRLGPDEDEGFFGNKPVALIAVDAAFHRVTNTREDR